MALVEAVLVLGVLAGAGETVLLEFSAPWCAPCRELEPVVDRLIQEGFPIRKINIDDQKDLTRQFRVDRLPCFITLVDGRETERVVGKTSYERLKQMFTQGHQLTSPPPRPLARQLLNAGHTAASSISDRRIDANSRLMATQNLRKSGPDLLTSEPSQSIARALAATVRIRVKEAGSSSCGTGTIVDVHGEEALVVTCGHIFRDSAGRGKIEVDLFTPQGHQTVPAQLVRYDLDNGSDLGLISIRPGMIVQPIPIARRSHQVSTGNHVLVTGCDRGGRPVWQKTQINSVNRYGGPANIQVLGTPPDGRSGGGLFSEEGFLIGVCNAADPVDQEGFYAALPEIHSHLENAGLSFVFEHDSRPDNSPQKLDRRLRAAQIICILDSNDQEQTTKEVILLENASPELIKQLALEVKKQNATASSDQRLLALPSDSAKLLNKTVPRNVVRAQNPRR